MHASELLIGFMQMSLLLLIPFKCNVPQHLGVCVCVHVCNLLLNHVPSLLKSHSYPHPYKHHWIFFSLIANYSHKFTMVFFSFQFFFVLFLCLIQPQILSVQHELGSIPPFLSVLFLLILLLPLHSLCFGTWQCVEVEMTVESSLKRLRGCETRVCDDLPRERRGAERDKHVFS